MRAYSGLYPSPHGKRGESERMSITPIVPDNKDALINGISALEWLLNQPDQDEKSKEIYNRTLKAYKEKLKQIGGE